MRALLEHERRMLEDERALLGRLELELRAGWHTVSEPPAELTAEELELRDRSAAAELDRRRRLLRELLELVYEHARPGLLPRQPVRRAA